MSVICCLYLKINDDDDDNNNNKYHLRRQWSESNGCFRVLLNCRPQRREKEEKKESKRHSVSAATNAFNSFCCYFFTNFSLFEFL